MNKQLPFLIVFIMFVQHLHAQLFYQNDIVVIENMDTLKNPWVGGLDMPQFSGADINNDGWSDLLIYDKKSSSYTVMLADSTGGFDAAPQLKSVFPKAKEFVLFRDYNCDGLVDIFAYENNFPISGGIRVYQQQLDSGRISFENRGILQYDFGGSPLNIYAVRTDIPSIIDIEGDGDLDFVLFPSTLFSDLTLFRNLSVEQGYGCDSLIYEEYTTCWGQIRESNLDNEIIFEYSCKGGPSTTPILSGGPKHAGSTSLVFDHNNDGKLDLLLGDVSYNTLILTENDATSLNAHMDSNTVDYTFPSYDTPLDMEIFPAPFAADVNNDGKQDLLVAPNSYTTSVNKSCVWYYKNNGSATNPYEFQTDDFLTGDMIDLGSHAAPYFVDLNGDSLLDMIVANGFLFDNMGSRSSLVNYYENVGTDTTPMFNLITTDFANLSSLGLEYLRPTFGDMDNDGDMDMLVGDENGALHFYENTAGSGNVATFVQTELNFDSLSVGNRAHPQLFDVNEDGLLDLVVGKEGSFGNIAYFWNFGTATAPAFDQDSVNLTLGNIDTNEPGFIQGFSAPFLLKTDSTTLLYTGSDIGNIKSYVVDADSLRNGSFSLLDSALFPAKPGIQSTIFITDINHDGALDYFAGNISGGVQYVSSASPQDTSIVIDTPIAIQEQQLIDFKLYPNPSNAYFTIQLKENQAELNIRIVNTLGMNVLVKTYYQTDKIIIDARSLSQGVYSIVLSNSEGEKSVKSFVKL